MTCLRIVLGDLFKSSFLLSAIPTHAGFPLAQREMALYRWDHCRGPSKSYSPSWLSSGGVYLSHPVLYRLPHSDLRSAGVCTSYLAVAPCGRALGARPPPPRPPPSLFSSQSTHSPDPVETWCGVWISAPFPKRAQRLPWGESHSRAAQQSYAELRSSKPAGGSPRSPQRAS